MTDDTALTKKNFEDSLQSMSVRESVKYMCIQGYVVSLFKGPDGLWRDALNTVWALQELEGSSDMVARCGIGMFSLALDSPYTALCRVHDYAYTSPAFQAFHTRKEADDWLNNQLEKVAAEPTTSFFNKILVPPMKLAVRVFGRFFGNIKGYKKWK